MKKEENTNQQTEQLKLNYRSNIFIQLIQSNYLDRPPFTRTTASQQLRIEATYRIQVRCAIPFRSYLTNCSNCIINIYRVQSPYYTADNVPGMGQIWSIRLRSVNGWLKHSLCLLAEGLQSCVLYETSHRASDAYPFESVHMIYFSENCSSLHVLWQKEKTKREGNTEELL